MLWLTGIGFLAIGIAIGYFLAGRVNNNPTKITELEQQLQDLQRANSRYRDEVSEHFSTTAELVQQMTESYKDVYQHLASGAQDLCSGEVASKLLPASSEPVFGRIQSDQDEEDGDGEMQAPKDYAPRQNASQTGALSEDFGLEKVKETEED
tara:strand:- start:271 stop:726 length:456 start_codon:yes stop_codon:yes gene_type:complete